MQAKSLIPPRGSAPRRTCPVNCSSAWPASSFPTAPELPTISESGVPGFDVSSWYALFVPAKTPAEIIAKLNAATVTALSEPAVRARFEPLGVVVESSTPEEMGALLQSEIDKWGPIIKAAGISASN
ncbi:MAG: hypothetical protein E6G74_21835 [Alphaproteobacteria bacterium]|nr:MAG: hypothetical protein E6G74_21835 [Alphaproteobacteria bacterium]